MQTVAAQSNCSCPASHEYFRENFDGPILDPRIWKGKDWMFEHMLFMPGTPALEYWVNFDRPEHGPQDVYQFSYDTEIESNILTLNTLDVPITARIIDYLGDSTILSDDLPNLRTQPYRTGMLMSKKLFKYGMYRWRVKIPGDFGPYPAIWFFREHTDSIVDEIDVMEYKSWESNILPINIHYGYPATRQNSPHSIDAGFNLAEDYVDYHFVWLPPNHFFPNTPTVQMFGVAQIDDDVVFEAIDNIDINSNMMMIMNHGVGGFIYEGLYESDGTLDLSEETFPFRMKFDEMSVRALMPTNCDTVKVCDFGFIDDNSVITGNRIELGGTNCNFKIPSDLKWEMGLQYPWYGKNLDVIACKEIVLKDGFHAERGSEFHARGIEQMSGKSEQWPDRLLEQAMKLLERTMIDTTHLTATNYNEHTVARGVQKVNKYFEADEYLGISPNPTNGQLTVNLDQIITQLEVTDPIGKLIARFSPNNTNAQLNLSGNSPGLYIISAILKDGSKKNYRVVLHSP